MDLVIIATRKKLSKQPMVLLLEALETKEWVSRLVVVELELISDTKRFAAAFRDVNFSAAMLIHKPHELFTRAYKRELHVYQQLEARFLYIQDKLQTIRKIHLRSDIRQIVLSVVSDSIHLPDARLLVDGLTDEIALWATTHAPLILKPNDSNNHCLYILERGDLLNELCHHLWKEADRCDRTGMVAGTCSEGCEVDLDLMRQNNYYLVEQYVSHTVVFKVYTYRGEIINLDFRAPLKLSRESSSVSTQKSQGPYYSINSQTCPNIQDSIAYSPSPIELCLLRQLARKVYAATGLSVLGIDALCSGDSVYVIDLNYFSGPKIADWERLLALLSSEYGIAPGR